MTPADCDLRNFAFMPVDIGRLFGSRFHAIANGDEWRAGVTLWLKSFHQVPAGSIPADDIELARLAEYGRDVRAWRKVREVALYGWTLCADGRLYHPVVAEKAIEASKKKEAFRERSRKANEKRWARHNSEDESARGEGVRANAPADVRSHGDTDFGARTRQNEGSQECLPHPNALQEASLKDSSSTPCQSQGTGTGTGTGTGSTPVANATAADAPIDPAKVMFDAGVRLLGQAGKSESAARGILGKWRKAYGEAAVIEALGAAQREAAIDPIGFIEGRWRAGKRRDDEGYSIGGTRMNMPC